MTTKIHASSAELGDCPHREEKQRAGEWQVQPQPYFIRGKCVHFAREFALMRFIEDGELPPLEVIEAKAIGDTEADEDEIDDRSPFRRHATDEELTEGIDEALPLIRADYAIGIPRIAPHVVAVEDAEEVPIEGTDIVLTGRMDIRGRDPMTGGATIVDTKTAKKNPGTAAQAKADMSQQLSIYAVMHRELYGTIPTHCLDYLWPGKRAPKAAEGVKVHHFDDPQPGDVKVVMRRVVSTQRSPSDLDAALRRLRVKVDAITHGWYPPAPVSGITSPCTDCWHRGNPDPSQRCEYVPDKRSAS